MTLVLRSSFISKSNPSYLCLASHFQILCCVPVVVCVVSLNVFKCEGLAGASEKNKGERQKNLIEGPDTETKRRTESTTSKGETTKES